MSINKDMTIAEVLKINPAAGGVFMAYGMHCIGCAIAAGETIAQAAEVHGIDIDKLVEELNKTKTADK